MSASQALALVRYGLRNSPTVPGGDGQPAIGVARRSTDRLERFGDPDSRCVTKREIRFRERTRVALATELRARNSHALFLRKAHDLEGKWKNRTPRLRTPQLQKLRLGLRVYPIESARVADNTCPNESQRRRFCQDVGATKSNSQRPRIASPASFIKTNQYRAAHAARKIRAGEISRLVRDSGEGVETLLEASCGNGQCVNAMGYSAPAIGTVSPWRHPKGNMVGAVHVRDRKPDRHLIQKRRLIHAGLNLEVFGHPKRNS